MFTFVGSYFENSENVILKYVAYDTCKKYIELKVV